MALGAHPLVSTGVGAEVVDQHTLPKMLAGFRMLVIPGPVLVLHELVTGGIVALETGTGDVRAAEKRPFQLFHLTVIGRGLSLFLGYDGMSFIGLGIFGYAQFNLRLVFGQYAA